MGAALTERGRERRGDELSRGGEGGRARARARRGSRAVRPPWPMRLRAAMDLLGLHADCTATEAKAAYKQQAMKLHPDRNQSDDANEAFQALGEAYTRVLTYLESGGKGGDGDDGTAPAADEALREMLAEMFGPRLSADAAAAIATALGGGPRAADKPAHAPPTNPTLAARIVGATRASVAAKEAAARKAKAAAEVAAASPPVSLCRPEPSGPAGETELCASAAVRAGERLLEVPLASCICSALLPELASPELMRALPDGGAQSAGRLLVAILLLLRDRPDDPRTRYLRSVPARRFLGSMMPCRAGTAAAGRHSCSRTPCPGHERARSWLPSRWRGRLCARRDSQ